jgi:hypothetical protein
MNPPCATSGTPVRLETEVVFTAPDPDLVNPMARDAYGPGKGP